MAGEWGCLAWEELLARSATLREHWVPSGLSAGVPGATGVPGAAGVTGVSGAPVLGCLRCGGCWGSVGRLGCQKCLWWREWPQGHTRQMG